jgi:hypothetical protein
MSVVLLGGAGMYNRRGLVRDFRWHGFKEDYGMLVFSLLSFVFDHELNGLHSSHNVLLIQKQWDQQSMDDNAYVKS